MARTLSGGDLQKLNTLLQDMGGKSSPALSKLLDENGNLKYDVPAKNVFEALLRDAAGKSGTKKLLSSPAFSKLMKGVMTSEWTLDPADVADPKKVKDLYAKTASDMSLISRAAAENSGNAANAVTRTGNLVQSNIEFVNNLAQTFTYVQLPIRMSNGNASADLYVYTNRKKNPEEGDEVSAFLHFDMDYLGPTDISVRMKRKSVQTKFFLDDEDSFRLIQNNIHILKDRLEGLGYTATIDVEQGDHPVNLVKDVLEKDAATGGSLQRYSFDMRA